VARSLDATSSVCGFVDRSRNARVCDVGRREASGRVRELSADGLDASAGDVEGIGRWRGEGESHARIYARHEPALQPPSSPGKSTRENATKQGTMQNSDE